MNQTWRYLEWGAKLNGDCMQTAHSKVGWAWDLNSKPQKCEADSRTAIQPYCPLLWSLNKNGLSNMGELIDNTHWSRLLHSHTESTINTHTHTRRKLYSAYFTTMDELNENSWWRTLKASVNIKYQWGMIHMNLQILLLFRYATPRWNLNPIKWSNPKSYSRKT